MSGHIETLEKLLVELRKVNGEFADASQQLQHLSERSFAQRDAVADRLRIGESRWENVSERISQVLNDNGTHSLSKTK